MQYMGGKAKVARRIVAAILADTGARDVWYEPFVGGGNVMEHAAPHFRRSVGSDAHQDLILMWQHVTAGGMLPPFVSREEYQALRSAPPSWLRGCVGFGASFGGKWFGGYGAQTVAPRQPNGHVYPGTLKAIERQAAVFSKASTRFRWGRFGDMTPPPGSVVYCDPPYAGTTAYTTGDFDYPAFYRTLRTWAADRFVYLSEYAVPEGVPAKVIWSREKRMVLEKSDNGRVAVENLYRILP